MADIREDHGPELIAEITENFVRKTNTTLAPAADLERAIEEVRSENLHPLITEMELALYRLLVKRCREVIQAQHTALALDDALMTLHTAEVTLLESMNAYLGSLPIRNAQKGAAAKNEKLEPVRQFAFRLAQEGSFPSRRQAVLAIRARVIEFAKTLGGISLSEQQAETTIDGWLKNRGYAPSARKRGMPAGEPTAAAGKDKSSTS